MLIRDCEVSQKWWWHCRDAMSLDNSTFLFDLAAQEYRSYKLSLPTRRTLYKAFMGYQCRCRYAAAMSVRLPGRERNDMARSRLNRMAKRVDVFVVVCFTTHTVINQPGKPASIICYLTRNEFTCFLLATRIPCQLTGWHSYRDHPPNIIDRAARGEQRSPVLLGRSIIVTISETCVSLSARTWEV